MHEAKYRWRTPDGGGTGIEHRTDSTSSSTTATLDRHEDEGVMDRRRPRKPEVGKPNTDNS
jgi:hypothetical protein